VAAIQHSIGSLIDATVRTPARVRLDLLAASATGPQFLGGENLRRQRLGHARFLLDWYPPVDAKRPFAQRALGRHVIQFVR
jgi:hypothetical protein